MDISSLLDSLRSMIGLNVISKFHHSSIKNKSSDLSETLLGMQDSQQSQQQQQQQSSSQTQHVLLHMTSSLSGSGAGTSSMNNSLFDEKVSLSSPHQQQPQQQQQQQQQTPPPPQSSLGRRFFHRFMGGHQQSQQGHQQQQQQQQQLNQTINQHFQAQQQNEKHLSQSQGDPFQPQQQFHLQNAIDKLGLINNTNILNQKNKSNKKSLLTFFIAYIIFLLPVVVSLIREFSIEWEDVDTLTSRNPDAPPHPRHQMLVFGPDKDGAKFFAAASIWTLTEIALYICLRLCGRFFGIKLHEKTLAKHKDDMLGFVYYGLAMSALAGIAMRIDKGYVNYETQLTFIPLVFFYTGLFTYLFELVKDRDITLSVALLSNKLGLFVVLVAVCVIIALFVSLFHSAFRVSLAFFQMYVGVFAVCSIIYLVLFTWYRVPFTKGKSYLHLHHWYWPIPLAHMCVFNTDVAMLAQAIFLAVHVHGVACFGMDPMFYDTERRARHPSEFEWVLRPHLLAKEAAERAMRESPRNPNKLDDKVNGNVVDTLFGLNNDDDDVDEAALDADELEFVKNDITTEVGGLKIGIPVYEDDDFIAESETDELISRSRKNDDLYRMNGSSSLNKIGASQASPSRKSGLERSQLGNSIKVIGSRPIN